MADEKDEEKLKEENSENEAIHVTRLDEQGLIEFKDALTRSDQNELEKVYDQYQPIDFAQEMDDFDDEEISQTNALMSDEEIGEILEQADEDVQNHIIKFLDNGRVLKIFKYMQKDNVADLLGALSIDRRKQLFSLMSGGDKRTLHELLGYSEDSAGGIMTTAYIALSEKLTVEEAIQKIKQIGPRTEVIETIYVLNEQRFLIGTADLRDILIADNATRLGEIMEDDPIRVEPEVDQEEVSHIFAKYDLQAMPVVNKRGAMLGIITPDDIIDVIVEEHTEDLYSMAGVSKEEGIDTSVFESVKMRLPWLVVNLMTAFLAAYMIKIFEGTIEQVVALSAVMTIISGMGGNAGTQTLSIMVRALALGEIDLKDCWKVLLKEIAVGVINGAANGFITGVVCWLIYGNYFLGIIVFMAMIGNLVVAGIFGFLVPVLLKACHQDPALGSSVLLTTATDTLGFFIFLGLATIFLPYLK
ncbi:MAG TPA: magnesium transporter [Lachnospiraceae bacterium]|nr:magnesium transporter [Lachnospiraceae bacterium]